MGAHPIDRIPSIKGVKETVNGLRLLPRVYHLQWSCMTSP